MTTDEAVVPADVVDDRRRKAALIKALGMDRSPVEQVELVLAIARRYDLDPMLKHVVLIEGRPFITRDGLLWVAHRSGVFDGMQVTSPTIVTIPNMGEFWTCTARVFRKDMTHPFEFDGRYPTKGGNQRFAPEMAVKVAESMALRRAFNVSAPTVDERWDLPTVQADVDAVSVPQQPPRTLAERVQERRATVGPPISSRPAGPSPDEDDEVTQSMGVARLEEKRAAPPTIDDLETCGDEDASPMALGMCDELPGHKGPHRSENGTWPR
jgi:hypothetical protein